MRTLGCLFAGALSAAAPLLAQDTAATGPTVDRYCYHARPKPACSVFFLTSAGAYVLTSAPAHMGSTSARAVVDWGVMVNVGRQDAIGASLFTVGDFDGFVGGPAVRYRRWLGRQASLDVAVGTSIAVSKSTRNIGQIKTGSLYGMVKWNPEHWFGVAARPELIRRTVVTSCCTVATRSEAQLSFGVEFGSVPGLVLSVPGLLAGLLAGFLVGQNTN